MNTPVCWRCQKPLTFEYREGEKFSTHVCPVVDEPIKVVDLLPPGYTTKIYTDDDEPDTSPRSHARTQDPDTSHEAAAAVESDLVSQCRKVEAWVRSRGYQGACGFEVQHHFATKKSDGWWKRLSDCVNWGWLVATPYRRRNPETMRRCVVIVAPEFNK